MTLPSIEFAFAYLTRSGRLQLDDLRRISPQFTARYEHYRGNL
jgi:hypothetical protein